MTINENDLTIGQIITIREFDTRTKTKLHMLKTEYDLTIVKLYPHHVLCLDEYGNKRCITNAQLYQLGYVHSHCNAPTFLEQLCLRGKHKVILQENIKWEDSLE